MFLQFIIKPETKKKLVKFLTQAKKTPLILPKNIIHYRNSNKLSKNNGGAEDITNPLNACQKLPKFG